MSKPGIHVIARFLRKILQNPQLSPTRVAAYSGINYYTAKQILALGFVEKVKTGKKKTRLKLTEKGKRFLEHYQEIERLLPF